MDDMPTLGDAVDAFHPFHIPNEDSYDHADHVDQADQADQARPPIKPLTLRFEDDETQSQLQIRPASSSRLSESMTTTLATEASIMMLNGPVIKDVPVSDPESPAYMALVKANETKVDSTLLEKRMRIGNKKIGRTKYKSNRQSLRIKEDDDPNDLKRKKKSRKSKSAKPLKRKSNDKKPDGTEIHATHEQYALTYGMMCGILNSAGMQNPFKQRLTMEDFMRVDKRNFPANAKLKHPFKFKDYSPDIFRQIRRRFCIDSADYMVTLCGDFNYIEFMSNSKSGQFFFYSHDGRFMIKTQTKDESKFLRRILPHYYKHVMENPNTLITRFYGMHRVKMHHLRRKMHFIIMASVFDTPLEIHRRFDLKGSLVGRQVSAEDKAKNPNVVLKDLDLLESGFKLQMGAERRAMLLVQIRKDVEFLKRMKIMDYSLLIGVHDASLERPKATQSLPTTPTMAQKPTPLATKPSWTELLQARLGRSISLPSDMSKTKTRTTNTAPASPPPNPMVPVSPVNSPTVSRDSPSSFGLSASDLSIHSAQYECERELGNGVSCSEEDESDDDEAEEEDHDDEDGLLSSDSDSDDDHESFGNYNNYNNDHGFLRTPSGSGSNGSLAPISPRVLDVAQFPMLRSGGSIFCKDDGGIYGRDRLGRKTGLVYFVGVIDILQQYNSRKIAETFFKGFRHNRKQISAVNPNFYGDRFIEFIEKNVILDDTLPPFPYQ